MIPILDLKVQYDALRDEIDVRTQTLDMTQVEQHEEDVVVARHEVRAGRKLGEEAAAVVLGDAIAAAVELAPVHGEAGTKEGSC